MSNFAFTHSGLIVPVRPSEPVDPWPAYRAAHVSCPKCGSTRMGETTTMGFGLPPNRNRTVCAACGWRGMVDDLLPPGRDGPSWRIAPAGTQLHRLAQRAGLSGGHDDEAVRFTFDDLCRACNEFSDLHPWAGTGEFSAGHIVVEDYNFGADSVSFCLSLSADLLRSAHPERPTTSELADLTDFLAALLRLDDDEREDPRREDEREVAEVATVTTLGFAAHLGSMTEDQRVTAIEYLHRLYCRSCGQPQPGGRQCQCENDE